MRHIVSAITPHSSPFLTAALFHSLKSHPAPYVAFHGDLYSRFPINPSSFAMDTHVWWLIVVKVMLGQEVVALEKLLKAPSPIHSQPPASIMATSEVWTLIAAARISVVLASGTWVGSSNAVLMVLMGPGILRNSIRTLAYLASWM
jgi:hypothetical protein